MAGTLTIGMVERRYGAERIQPLVYLRSFKPEQFIQIAPARYIGLTTTRSLRAGEFEPFLWPESLITGI